MENYPLHGPWEHHAFLPHPLTATSPDLTPEAYRAVAEARASLAALDATAQHLPNPRLFRHSALRLEAQSTAALEGTYEPLARVLVEDPADGHNVTMREVLNYLTVAEAAFEWSENGRRWTLGTVGELHRLLMAGTASEREYHGVRPIQVVIGEREGARLGDHPIHAAQYVPPPPGDDLNGRLADLLDWMQSDHQASIDPVVAAAMGHYTFEALHPFHDGNGRIGRLLIVLQLKHHGILTEPSITVSSWFEARRQRYYDALLGVSTTGDWPTWVGLFAKGLTQSAEDARARMLALSDVQMTLKDKLKKSRIRSARARVLIDYAVGHPAFTIRQAAEGIGLTYQGTKKLVDSLVELGVLAELGERTYNRRFHAPMVLAVLMRGNDRYGR